jgi:hypothetical protein
MMISCEALMAHLEGAPFPASKEELVAFLQDRAAPVAAVWMLERIPGRFFRFATDVENTVRLAHELRLDQPWEEDREPRPAGRSGRPGPVEGGLGPAAPQTGSREGNLLALAIQERLRRCRSINPCLIRVRVEGTVAILEGRVADVLQGLRAAQVAGGVPGVRWVINNLEVAT